MAGYEGPNTVYVMSAIGPTTRKLHFVLDAWNGDALLATGGNFVVTQALCDQLIKQWVTGFDINTVEITKSEQFQESAGDVELPTFIWLDVTTGIGGQSDLFQWDSTTLIISQKAMDVMRQFQTLNMEWHEFATPTQWLDNDDDY